VLPLVCLRLGLLRLRPRPVAAAVVAPFAPGLAVLSTLARATRWGRFTDLAGVWAWLRTTCLPSRASHARCRARPGAFLGQRGGWRELTRPRATGWPGADRGGRSRSCRRERASASKKTSNGQMTRRVLLAGRASACPPTDHAGLIAELQQN
jgi:hypothetical protein